MGEDIIITNLVEEANKESIEMISDRYNVGGRAVLINDGRITGFEYETRCSNE